MKITIKIASDEHEFSQACELRWTVLRKPWNQPKGSETDNLEATAITVIAIENTHIVGTGRAHFISPHTVQFRYMAVKDDRQGAGIGKKILQFLEHETTERGAHKVFLNARQNAVKFYLANGYRVVKEVEMLYGEIRHFLMEKELI